MAEARRRRTQQERSAETIDAILRATIDLLYERGFYRTSATDIAERAGVSRGALNHHFASKEDVVVSAIRHQLQASTARLHAMARTIRERGGSTDEVVDFIWSLMTDRLYFVTMEYLPEVRHNRDFKDKVVVVVKEFHAGLEAIWSELAEQFGTDVVRTATVMNATMCTVRGMIAQSASKDDARYFDDLLNYCKEQVAREIDRMKPASEPPGRHRVGGRP